MNISTLAKILGVSVKELKQVGSKNGIYGFNGRNTRIPYKSAMAVTKILQPEKLAKLQNDDKIYLPATISVADLAETIGKPSGLVVKSLLLNGVMATLNEKIDYDTASLIAAELNVEVFPESPEMFEDDQQADTQLIKTIEYDGPEADKTYVDRGPVVTIMGHVDHGKTTLLDFIRKSNVADGEAGSITQHISSYKIRYQDKDITFVDTPGHEAFTAMRARGSQLADFVILVVSATEGPKPQTVEVIERSKLSKVPLIVALNKIDLPESDVEKVKTEISKFGLVPEEWGGEVPFIPISAKTGEGVDKLLETLLLNAEMAELKAEVKCQAQGIVIESHRDRNLGVVSTVLIVKDQFSVGDTIRAGEYVAKVRKMETSSGKNLEVAKFGDPIMLLGLPEVVDIGETLLVYDNNKEAHKAAIEYKEKKAQTKVTSFRKDNDKKTDKQINLVLKADVAGSLEALKEAIIKIPQDKVKAVIKSESVGEISENDVEFAQTAEATILAFHTSINSKAEKLIQKLEVNMVKSDIIYEILEWVESEILKNVDHEVKITSLGKAKVLALFKADKPTIQVIGAEVIQGKIFDNKVLRVWRSEEEVGRLEILELQKNKSKVTEVNINQQFGVSVTGRAKVKEGDIIESIEENVLK